MKPPSIQWRYLLLTLPMLLQACQTLSTEASDKTNGTETQNSSDTQQSSAEPAIAQDQTSQLPSGKPNQSEQNTDNSDKADTPDIAQLPQSPSESQSQTENDSGTSQAHWPGAISQPVLRPTRTGNLPFRDLNEISGLAASGRDSNRLWAINDSGNRPALYAFTREAKAIGVWPIDIGNRDWEALAATQVNGEPYLMVAEIGDNLRQHDHYTLHLIREPQIDGRAAGTLSADWTIRFRYEDGAHNAEALAIVGNQILIITKEPLGSAGAVPGGIYGLDLPSLAQLSAYHGNNSKKTPMLVASRLGTMAAQSISFEARLAARFASVDLNHATALDIDQINSRLWVLTYRHVIRFDRTPQQSWAQALAGPGIRIHAHTLAQAESMTVTDDALLWFSSEGGNAPLWVLPPL